MLLFASAKSNQKQTEGCGPLDSQRRFKTRAVKYQEEVERFCALSFFAKIYKCRKTHGHVLNRCEREVVLQTQNRVLRKIEVAVRACRRKQSMKRETARYLCCGWKGKPVWVGRKLRAKP